MRMRKKKHGAERIAACAEYLIPNPPEKAIAEYFSEKRPIHLEIGAGKGGFAVGLTEKNHDFNLVAMERSSDAACVAIERTKATADARPDNLRIFIADAANLTEYFPPHSVECIYINFSDPWPKKGHAKRRLTYKTFLDQYKQILVEGGMLKQKTDNEGLFDFSLEQYAEAGLKIEMQTRDLHATELAEDNVMTEYESHFVSEGKPIYSAWVRF